MKVEIQKIHIVQTVDEKHDKSIDQVLVVFQKKHPRYLELFSSYSKTPTTQEKYEKRIKKRLVKYLPNLTKEDLSKVVFVNQSDEDTKKFVSKTIDLLKNEKYNKRENVLHLMESSTFFPGLIFHIPPLTALSAVFSVLAMGGNSKRKLLPQNQSPVIRKIKFGFSFCLFFLNGFYRIYDFSMNYETMCNRYQLSRDIDDVLSKRKILLDTIDNPFDEEIMVLSEEDATNLLMESFSGNPLLQESDLEIFSNLEQYIKENPYLDYGKLYDDFSSFGIIDTDLKYGNIDGQKFEDFIVVYDSSNQNEESYRRIVEHELVHRTGHLDNALLNEGMTSLIVYEYMEDFKTTDGYYDQLLVTKVFCELITPEKMLEAYSKDDMNIIKDELLKLNPSLDDYQKLMTLLDQYGKEMSVYTKKGQLEEFFKTKSPSFREDLRPLITAYIKPDLEVKKRLNIVNYLYCIGLKTNVVGDAYFNPSGNDIPEKVYFKE